MTLTVAKEQAETPPTVADAGYDASRLNAVRHGILSRFTVLPWEEAAEYDALIAALTEEHAPAGPTETHLVVELAGVLWRKRRLRLAETAAYKRGLKSAIDRDLAKPAMVHVKGPAKAEKPERVIRATEADAAAIRSDLDEDEAMTHRALEILGSMRNDGYEAGLAALREDTQAWWARELARPPDELDEGEQPATAEVAGLRHFIEAKVLPWFKARRRDLELRPLIRDAGIRRWAISAQSTSKNDFD